MSFKTYIQAAIHVLDVLKQDMSAISLWLTRQGARFGLGKHGLRTGGACFILTLLIIMTIWLGPGETLIQLLGLAGMLLILKSSTFQDNRHKRTASSLGGVLTTSQMGLLHAWGGMLQTGLATARAFLMAALPDEMKKPRLAATIVFYGMALCIYEFFLPPSPYNILPLLTMTLGTTADFFPSSMSRHTRVFYILGTAAMIPYHILVSHSIGALGVTAAGVALLYRTALHYDIPAYGADGRKLGAWEKHGLWLKSLFNAHPVSGLLQKS